MLIPIHILVDPNSSATGKYYIGVELSQNPFALYGANTSNNSGTKTVKDTVSKLKTLINTKKRKGYAPADLTAVPNGAIQNALDIVAKSLNQSKDTLDVISHNGGWVIQTAQSSTPGPRQAPKPKIKKVEYKVWI